MAESIVPHFHNEPGVAVIEIGAKEFMCVGALPPFDHPHVYCDMGDDNDYTCPYCSTLFRHNAALAPDAARPAESALHDLRALIASGGRIRMTALKSRQFPLCPLAKPTTCP